MAQERPLTPEKQLLNLIESGNGKTAPAVESGVIKRKSLSFFSFGAWKGRASFFGERFKKSTAGFSFKQLNIRAVNTVLGIVAFFLFLYLIVNFFVSVDGLKKNLTFEVKTGTAGGTVLSSESSALKKPVGVYLEKIKERDIFSLGEKGPAYLTESKGPSSRTIEATQDLKLVGISWSDDPDAMIEDKKALRTFFVKQGQMIGDVKVEAITKDTVILSYGGDEIELK